MEKVLVVRQEGLVVGEEEAAVEEVAVCNERKG
jgi:hypothetical protein